MSDNAIVTRRQDPMMSMDDIERVAMAMTKSGFFQDSKDQAQAIVKILAGREMGFGPFASMTGIFIIQGRPSIGANLMAGAVKSSGRYNYRVLEMSDTVCEIAFFEAGKEIGRSRFTIEDAKKAQTKNLDKFPRNMLFARAISNGVRWYCPDAFNGAAVYTPEELGADVDQEGNVIPGTFTQPVHTVYPAEPVPEPQTLAEKRRANWKSEISFETAAKETSKNSGARYVDTDGEKLGFVISAAEKHLNDCREGREVLTPEQIDEWKIKRDVAAACIEADGGK